MTEALDRVRLVIVQPYVFIAHAQVWTNVGEPVGGQVRVIWRPHIEGEHLIHIFVNGVRLPESPFSCSIRYVN
jgi:hypothetical protein